MQNVLPTLPVLHVSDPTFCPQLFVYTCAKRDYAEKILNILDPQRKVFRSVLHHMTPFLNYSAITSEASALLLMTVVFCLHRHRLYQEDCVCVLGHYIKDLSILGRDLAKTVVLDNMPHTYPYHVSTAQLSLRAFHRVTSLYVEGEGKHFPRPLRCDGWCSPLVREVTSSCLLLST